MDSSTGQKNNGKNLTLSILSGIAYAIGVFLISAVVFVYIGTAVVEGGPMGIVTIAPIIGIIIGIIGGRGMYKRLSTKK